MSEERTENSSFVWVIYFIGFDDHDPQSPKVKPSVGFERIEASNDSDQRHQDATLAALLRGGQLLAVIEEDSQEKAAAMAAAFEKEIFRIR